MAGKKLKLSIFGIVVVAIAAIGIKYAAANDSNPTVNWTSGAPMLEKVNDYASTPSGIPKCTTAKIPVQRSYISSPIEEHCFVQTAMGLMTQLYRNDGVVQAQSYAKGYPVNFLQGGNPSIDPIPNQASGIYASVYSQGPGLVYGYVPQISNVLQFKIGVGGMYYEIPAGSNISKTFAKAAGGVAPFNPATKSISANGRYMVIDGLGAGFIRINLMNLTVRSFSPTLIKVNGTSLLDANTAIDDSGRFAAIAYNAPGAWGSKYFKLVDVDSCATPEMDYQAILDRNSFNCQSVDLLAVLKQTVPTAKEVFNLQFSNDRTISFDVAYTSGSSTKYTRYSITAPGQSRSLKQYLALGDSYISGEGAYSYREGTDTSRNLCHQSLLSYPYLLGAKLNSFASVACSGARMGNIMADHNVDQLEGDGGPTEYEEGQAVYGHLPGFVAQKEFIKSDNPDAITVSIGGNDIGFGDIVKQCVNPIQEGWHGVVTAETCYDNYEDRAELVNQINSKFTQLRQLYKDLKKNDATGRRVYVIAYPQVVKVDGECGQNVLMNSDEVQFAHDMVAYLDNVIKRAADEAGVFYVDTQHAFDGHLLCEASTGEAAMNGFTISRKPDGGYDFRASFHPNQRGHQMLADTIVAQTANLTTPMPAPLPESSGPTLDTSAAILQNVPKLNRPLRYVRAIDDLAEKIVNPSTYVDIALNAQDFLTQANGVYNLVIHSDPVSLGNFTADAQGNVNVHAAVPDGTPPGFHTLHLYGNDMYGNPIDIQQVIFVTAPVTANGQSDMDGDGLPDVTDSCVLASQSGSDIDQDGIDDTCDPLISAAPTTPPGGTDGEPADIVWWDKAYVPITIHISSGR